MITPLRPGWYRWPAKTIFLAKIGLALLLPVPAAAAEPTYPSDRMCRVEQLCRRCDGPACMKVAAERPWPAERLADGVRFEVDNFRLVLPPAPEKIVYFGGGGVAFRYPGRKTITIEYERAAQFGVPEHQDQKAKKVAARPGALAFADTPRIQFTKTPADAEPIDLADRRVWRLGLILKHSAFAHTDSPFFASRGSGTLFVRSGIASAADVTAHLVHAQERDSYLTITSIGFPADEFMRVLGGIEAKERQQ